MQNLPSPIDIMKRWPRAVMAVSSLVLKGDEKYADDGRDNSERGAALDQVRYGVNFSDEKRLRHMARRFDGEDYDDEMRITHLASEAWHALNALQAYCEEQGWSVDDIINGRHWIEPEPEPEPEVEPEVEPEAKAKSKTLIGWYGGDNPVSDDTQVEVKFRDGGLNTHIAYAGTLNWHHDTYARSNIMAYRVIDE